jgi:hypothetical protein
MAACAVLEHEFLIPTLLPDFSYLSHDVERDEQPVYSDAAVYSVEDAAIDAELAEGEETTAEVEALMAFAFATHAQTYDLVARTVAGFTSKDMQHADYAAMLSAAARVALERSYPLLFQEYLAGSDSEEIRSLVGAELSKLRPAQLVWREPAPRAPRIRKPKSTARFLGWS